MCKIVVTQFTCGHNYDRWDMCDWMRQRPHRVMHQCPYHDPKGVLVRDTSMCRECFFVDRETPSQFRDPNGIKRAPPPQKSLAGRELLNGGGGTCEQGRGEAAYGREFSNSEQAARSPTSVSTATRTEKPKTREELTWPGTRIRSRTL
ncbi:hypothetical protein TWF718_008541 [Orbilia javanica]|uniref:Uncharacterized protein n=1 Tax=Orbilia javanica TaxID=47235 RepID=A0AAN8RD68_9PEZI